MSSFGGAIKLTGESEYRKALKSITDNLTVLSSELKVASSEYDKNDTSTQNLAKQNEILNKRLEEQNRRLAEAKKMLREAETAENSNAQTVAKWQKAVNDAQAEVNKTNRTIEQNTKIIEENEKSVDELGDTVEQTGKQVEKAGNGGYTVFKNILANLGTKVISGVVDGMKSLAGAVVNVGKQAIQSYADYEQLIGGVETLFKESAGVVTEYANNAYKIAGLSANDYMETVTSFSASLLQSLGQDTAKASQYADQAIIDMSDNANKMGTDMSMIQSAYQGFAKQNYTMLDNLKLGYGGTKEEMARLIEDANKVKEANGGMADLTLSSFADIVEAIHIIQTEMGITGTTAKEASTTISGSVNAMKSAWSNLLTGIADENADFGQLVTNFVDSLMTVSNNLMPVVEQVIVGMGQLATSLLTEIVPEIINTIPPLIESALPALITSVQSITESILAVLPQVVTTIKEFLPDLLSTLVGMLPQLVEVGTSIIFSLIDGISSALPSLIPAVVQAVMTIVNHLLDNVDLLIETGFTLLSALIEGILNAIPVLIDNLPTIIEKLISTLLSYQYEIVNCGIQLLAQLTVGIIQAIPQLVAKIPQIISSIIKGFANGMGNIKEIGSNIVAGIGQGMLDALGSLWNSVVNIGSTVVGWFKDIFGIHSPSTVFADQIGKNLALGLDEGFEKTMKEVSEDMTDAVPTDFNIETPSRSTSISGGIIFSDLVDAFKQALTEVNIVLDDEVAGKFVTDTVERVVYS